jgi:hypothetical protein
VARASLQGQPFDEFHAQADGIVVLIDAVNGHDIGVADAREQASFLNDRRGPLRVVHDLQRDFTLECGIPGEVHGAEAAASELAADVESAPCFRQRRWRNRWRGPRRFAGGAVGGSKIGHDVELRHRIAEIEPIR